MKTIIALAIAALAPPAMAENFFCPSLAEFTSRDGWVTQTGIAFDRMTFDEEYNTIICRTSDRQKMVLEIPPSRDCRMSDTSYGGGSANIQVSDTGSNFCEFLGPGDTFGCYVACE